MSSEADQSEPTKEKKVDKGDWPSAFQQFRWDLGRAKRAPRNSGLRGPKFSAPEWLDGDRASSPEAVARARAFHQQQVDRSTSAEARAARMLQTCLALITVSFAVGGFTIKAASGRGVAWPLFLVPAGFAIVFLAIAAVEALEVDRVGLLQQDGARVIVTSPRTPAEAEVLEEERAAFTAAWTAGHKLSGVLDARAWLSRGLVALILAGLVGLSLVASPKEDAPPMASPSPAMSSKVSAP